MKLGTVVEVNHWVFKRKKTDISAYSPMKGTIIDFSKEGDLVFVLLSNGVILNNLKLSDVKDDSND